MTAEPSPRPWQVRYGDTVADATCAKVAACWRPENAALIVSAVNERDRLRGLVRRLAALVVRYADDDGAYSDAYDEIAEARAAIGEDKP